MQDRHPKQRGSAPYARLLTDTWSQVRPHGLTHTSPGFVHVPMYWEEERASQEKVSTRRWRPSETPGTHLPVHQAHSRHSGRDDLARAARRHARHAGAAEETRGQAGGAEELSVNDQGANGHAVAVAAEVVELDVLGRGDANIGVVE